MDLPYLRGLAWWLLLPVGPWGHLNPVIPEWGPKTSLWPAQGGRKISPGHLRPLQVGLRRELAKKGFGGCSRNEEDTGQLNRETPPHRRQSCPS